MLSRQILILLGWENLLILDIGRTFLVLVRPRGFLPHLFLIEDYLLDELKCKFPSLPFEDKILLFFLLTFFFSFGCEELTSCAHNCSVVFCSETIELGLVLS